VSDPSALGDSSAWYAVATVPIDDPTGSWPLEGNNDFTIYIPPNAVIGMFSLGVINRGIPYDTGGRVIIIFNPWSPAETVYLSDESSRQEYLLNEQGLLWLTLGGGATGWTFDQFNMDVLRTTLYFVGQLIYSERNDVIAITRQLSALMNANDDNGLVTGKWAAPWGGGTLPWAWRGSGRIFSTYLRNNARSIGWGQCWVFAGVLVSGCRTLGIPARPITNFNSAHEPAGSGPSPYRNSIDYFYNRWGKQVKTLGSIWNYHAWVEAWFDSHWHAIDATPQEKSANLYRLGPAALRDVKGGLTQDIYDVDFVYSEINSQIRYYVPYRTRRGAHPFVPGYWLLSAQSGRTGTAMITKQRGGLNYEFITNGYKETAKSVETDDFANEEIGTNFVVPDSVSCGDIIRAELQVTCFTCDVSPRTVNVLISARITNPDSTSGVSLKELNQTILLSNQATLAIRMNLTVDDYEEFLAENNYLWVEAFTMEFSQSDNSTSQFMDIHMEEVDILSPNLDLAQVDNSTISVGFTNPLSIPLTNVVLLVHGTNVESSSLSLPDINPFETISRQLPLSLALRVASLRDTDIPIFVSLLTVQIPKIEGYFVLDR